MINFSAKLGIGAAVGSWLVAASATGLGIAPSKSSSRGSAPAALQGPEIVVYKSPT